MFFWFPISTDAPVYHFPWATISLIAANCFVFAAGVFGHFPVEEWVLHYGQIAPVEWITSNFVHSGAGHLLGNLFFLWSIGLIVEGKLGWRLFLLIYLGIGMAQCAIEQFFMLGAEGHSLGASSIVFGLTAIALVWAPKNEISFAWFFWLFFFIRAGVTEVTVMTYSLVILAVESLMFTVHGFHIGASALHLMGAVLGYGIGAAMVKKNLVDCEGWDLFSVMRGTHLRMIGDDLVSPRSVTRTKGSRRRQKRKPSRILTVSSTSTSDPSSGLAKKQSRLERAHRRILQHLQDGKALAAHSEMVQLRNWNPSYRLDAIPLRRLAQGLIQLEQWPEAIELLEEYIARFEQDADAIRVRLALLLLTRQRRPRAALNAVERVNPDRLPERLRQRLVQLRSAANQMIDSGVIELSRPAHSAE
jgi:membrane associated rhomboid family serine protease